MSVLLPALRARGRPRHGGRPLSTPATNLPAPAPRHVYLIDGSGFIFRAFHKLPPLSRPDGTPVNAVLGFTNMLLKLMHDTDADHLAVIFDAAKRTFRSDLYTDYKAHRPEPPDELLPQFPLIREAVRAFNVACIESEGWEADDLIATYTRLAREAGAEVTIVSSDKDLMQLIRPGVEMFDPVNSKVIGPEQVKEKFCVGPEKVIEVQALAGDSIDNVPGVPGIGVKTAAQLIEEYGDLDTLLARAHEIRQPKRREALLAHAEAARISRDLVRLCDRRAAAGAARRSRQARAGPGAAAGVPAGERLPLGDRPATDPRRSRPGSGRARRRGGAGPTHAGRGRLRAGAGGRGPAPLDLRSGNRRLRRHRYRGDLAGCRSRRHRRHLAGDRSRARPATSRSGTAPPASSIRCRGRFRATGLSSC